MHAQEEDDFEIHKSAEYTEEFLLRIRGESFFFYNDGMSMNAINK